MLQTKLKKITSPNHSSTISSCTRNLEIQTEANIVAGRLSAKETIFNHFFSIFTNYLFLAILLL
jgi:hypothetical protein